MDLLSRCAADEDFLGCLDKRTDVLILAATVLQRAYEHQCFDSGLNDRGDVQDSVGELVYQGLSRREEDENDLKW